MRLLLPLMIGGLPHLGQHPFSEDLCGGLPAEAFSGRIVELIAELLQFMVRHLRDVSRAW